MIALRVLAVVVLVVVAWGVAPGHLVAQAQPGVDAPSVIGSARWFYPRGERRDPVVPPAALYSGEGFPSLRVSVIMYDPQDRDDSRALVHLDGSEPVRRVVRAGDRVGRYRIRQVLRDCVRVETNTLGSTRVESLCLARGDSASASR